tara:strand:- start:8627 stop:9616 length:990 start_codon:yes stop_codon:yes gene_type:complete
LKNDEFYISLVGEVFDGYTKVAINKSPVYIKHLNIRDQRYLQSYYEKYKQRAVERGVDTTEERTRQIVEDGMWTDAEDQKIAGLRFEIDNLKKTIKGIFLPSQQDEIKKSLKERREELTDLLSRKEEVIGKTADSYAMGRSNDELLRFLLFKKPDLKENLYSEEEFSNLEIWEIAGINKIQEEVAQRLSDTAIQEAVLRPFFSMYLSFCESVGDFYGKPIIELSVYQLRVALYGKMFFNIFQNTQDIPDNIRDNPEKLMAFAETKQNADSHKGGVRDDADVSAIFGATKGDMQALDLGNSANVSLSEEAAKHGGKLNMEQMMRLAGQDV